MVETSVDHRLRANQQALRYGIGTEEEHVTAEETRAMADAVLDGFVRIAEEWGHPRGEIVTRARELAQAARLAREKAA